MKKFIKALLSLSCVIVIMNGCVRSSNNTPTDQKTEADIETTQISSEIPEDDNDDLSYDIDNESSLETDTEKNENTETSENINITETDTTEAENKSEISVEQVKIDWGFDYGGLSMVEIPGVSGYSFNNYAIVAFDGDGNLVWKKMAITSVRAGAEEMLEEIGIIGDYYFYLINDCLVALDKNSENLCKNTGTLCGYWKVGKADEWDSCCGYHGYEKNNDDNNLADFAISSNGQMLAYFEGGDSNAYLKIISIDGAQDSAYFKLSDDYYSSYDIKAISNDGRYIVIVPHSDKDETDYPLLCKYNEGELYVVESLNVAYKYNYDLTWTELGYQCDSTDGFINDPIVVNNNGVVIFKQISFDGATYYWDSKITYFSINQDGVRKDLTDDEKNELIKKYSEEQYENDHQVDTEDVSNKVEGINIDHYGIWPSIIVMDADTYNQGIVVENIYAYGIDELGGAYSIWARPALLPGNVTIEDIQDGKIVYSVSGFEVTLDKNTGEIISYEKMEE